MKRSALFLTAALLATTAQAIQFSAPETLYVQETDPCCISNLKATLSGEWTNITYSGDTPDLTFQNLTFKKDGTLSFVRSNGSPGQGTWEVSKDGKSLVLRLANRKSKRDEITITAKIVKLDGHGLVFDQALPGKDGNMLLKTFTFIK